MDPRTGSLFDELTHEINDGAIHCVDVMPPETDWRGGQRLVGYEPHPTDWAVYLNGDPVGRVAAREMIEPRLEMIVPTVEERLRALAASRPRPDRICRAAE